MKKRFEVDQKCQTCEGTGLYSGFAEKDGASVVCRDCQGTGHFIFAHEYEVFTERAEKNDTKWVIQINPGIEVHERTGSHLSDFGGMSYEDWKHGRQFSKGMEMRKFTCPAWWYGLIDLLKVPKWDECTSEASCRECKYFPTKDRCWSRFDDESTDR